jgi:Uma2 family endonuclease
MKSVILETGGGRAMATTTTHVPVEVYLRSSYEPDAEYVDGEIERRPMGELDHAARQLAILKYFLPYEKTWGVYVFPELRVHVSATRYRVPDITVLDRSLPLEQIITRPPLAVFEVLSPEDRLQRLKRKLEDYRVMGIPEIWVIDPQDSTFYRYEDLQLRRKEMFSHSEKGIAFDLNELKNLLPEKN